MASFNPTVITKKGQSLISKIMTGSARARFTKIKTSDYEYDNNTLEDVTVLDNLKQTSSISDVVKLNKTSVKISAAISNKDLLDGYYIRNIGLYAQDPNEGEILYSITTANNPDWMPANNGTSSSTIMVDLISVVANSDNITVEVNPKSLVTVEQLNEALQNTNNMINYKLKQW